MLHWSRKPLRAHHRNPFNLALQFSYPIVEIDHYMQANFPSDSEGRLCGIDNDTKDYHYVYFVNPPNIVTIALCRADECA